MKPVGTQLKRLLKTSPLTLALVLFPFLSLAIDVKDVPNPRQINGTWVTDMAVASGTPQTTLAEQLDALSQEPTQDANGTWVLLVGGGLVLAIGTTAYLRHRRGSIQQKRKTIPGTPDSGGDCGDISFSAGDSGGDYSGSDYSSGGYSSSDCDGSNSSSSDNSGGYSSSDCDGSSFSSSYSSSDCDGSNFSSSDSSGSYSSSDSSGGSNSSSSDSSGSYSSSDSSGGSNSSSSDSSGGSNSSSSDSSSYSSDCGSSSYSSDCGSSSYSSGDCGGAGGSW